MLEKSLQTREIIFAHLFGPPRFIGRDEAYALHPRLCEALAVEDLSFQYKNPESPVGRGARAFNIRLERTEGRGKYEIQVEHPGGRNPIRLLIRYVWPPSPEHVRQVLNISAEATFGGLGGKWQKVLAEARLRAQCSIQGSDAGRFLQERVFSLPSGWYKSLGEPVIQLSAKMIVAATAHQEDPMAGAKRDLTIEVLQEDPRWLYLELISQWPQLPQAVKAGEEIGPAQVRSVDAEPMEYVDDAYDFLERQVGLLKEGKKTEDQT